MILFRPMRIALVVSLVMLSHAVMLGCGSRKISDGIWAEYNDKEFRGTAESFREIYLGGERCNDKIAPMWLKLKDGEVIELATLQEDRARSWDLDVRKGRDFPGSNSAIYRLQDATMYCLGERLSGASFTFLKQRLVSCVIRDSADSPLAGVQIGPSSTGEFISLPISREDLIRVFGKPDVIHERWVKGPPN